MNNRKLIFLMMCILSFTRCANNSEEDPIDELSFDCSQTVVSLENDVMPILLAQCTFSGCHNGDLGASRDWTEKSTVIAKAAGIKGRTQTGSMPRSPGVLSQNQIDLIACWVDNGALDN